jgi:hypothetical protein
MPNIAEVAVETPANALLTLKAIGRTEDVRFAPSGRRLALAGFARNSVLIVDLMLPEGTADPGGADPVRVTGVFELTSPALSRPHGVEFLDDDTVIVANRAGGIQMLRIDADEEDHRGVMTRARSTASGFDLLGAPGSVRIAGRTDAGFELLVCDNANKVVTRHVVSVHKGRLAAQSSEVLLHRWLEVPDGVAVTGDGRWVAVSNHEARVVMCYDRTLPLNEQSDPCGILLGACYPHGLQFTADGRHLVVTDAGSPFVHVYATDDSWHGVRLPAGSVRVMDDDTFERGNRNPAEGGPKGIDIDVQGTFVVVTSELMGLAFFRLADILRATVHGPDQSVLMRNEMQIIADNAEIRARLAWAQARPLALTRTVTYRIARRVRHLLR